QSLFDDAVLIPLAVEVGLATDVVTAFLKTDRYADTVREEQEFITSCGAQGVPFFVVNNRYALSGAQPPQAFTQALEAAWKDIAPQITDGEACGPDGCAI
ncbi:MAG: hypothetical protein B7Z26_00915, partial [Asticcacaulis sp. 32-58-5]